MKSVPGLRYGRLLTSYLTVTLVYHHKFYANFIMYILKVRAFLQYFKDYYCDIHLKPLATSWTGLKF